MSLTPAKCFGNLFNMVPFASQSTVTDFSQTLNAQVLSQLIQLPREILLQILTHILYHPEALAIKPRPWLSVQRSLKLEPQAKTPVYRQNWSFTPSILRCCQLLHQIAHSILYGANSLAIDWDFQQDQTFSLLYDSAHVPQAWYLRQRNKHIDTQSVGLFGYYSVEDERPDDSVFRLPLQTMRYLLKNIQKFRVDIRGSVRAHLLATHIGFTVVERACLIMRPVIRGKEMEVFMQPEVGRQAGQHSFDLPWSEEVLSGFRVLRCSRVRINGIEPNLAKKLEWEMVNRAEDCRTLNEGEYLPWKEISTNSPFGTKAILGEYQRQIGQHVCEFLWDDIQSDLRHEADWDFEKRVTWSYAA